MAITYFNSASTPADNGTSVVTPTAVTPPASMVTGDLVLLIGQTRAAAATIEVSETGGQSWTAAHVGVISNTNVSARIFFARYNGTWGADPSLAFTGTAGGAHTVVMHVFRPTSGSLSWGQDGSLVELDFTAPSTPFTVTITGRTTGQASTVTLAGWFTPDDNTWGSLSGTGWVVTGAAQYRNTAGQDSSATFAHNIQTSAGATNNVSKNQATLGGDAGTTFLVTFYEFEPAAVTTRNLAALGVG